MSNLLSTFLFVPNCNGKDAKRITLIEHLQRYELTVVAKIATNDKQMSSARLGHRQT